MLYFADGQPFAQGASPYDYRSIQENRDVMRVFVPIQVEGFPVEAILDTGGLYLICTSELAREIGLNPSNSIGSDVLSIRGYRYSGRLYRVSIELMAQEGDSLLLEVTAFVPDGQSELSTQLPVFLGMQGCLERLRFAVDPATERFFFGYPWADPI